VFFHLPKCLILVLSDIYISQGSEETYLQYGWIYNNYVIANCLQSVPVKEFWKSVNNWRRYGHMQSATFFMDHHIHISIIFVYWKKLCVIVWCFSRLMIARHLPNCTKICVQSRAGETMNNCHCHLNISLLMCSAGRYLKSYTVYFYCIVTLPFAAVFIALMLAYNSLQQCNF